MVESIIFKNFNIKNYSIYISITLLYLIFLLQRPLSFSVGSLNLVLWDLWPFLGLLLIYLHDLKIRFPSKIISLIILFSFLIYIYSLVLGALYFDPKETLTLFFQYCRCLLIFFILYILLSNIEIKVILSFIVNIGFIYSIISLFLYYLAIVLGVNLNVFEIGEFKSIRFSSLTKDANFMALFLSFSFFLSSLYKKNLIKSLPIFMVIILSLSRSMISAILIIYLIIVFYSQIKSLLYIALTFIFCFFIFFLSDNFYFINNYIDILALRFTSDSPRFDMWQNLINNIWDAPLLGHGLRSSAPIALASGQNKYAHSSIIESLYEQGIFGCIAMLLICLYPLGKYFYINKLSQKFVLPLIASHLVSIISLGGFTLWYIPYFWFCTAFILVAMEKKY